MSSEWETAGILTLAEREHVTRGREAVKRGTVSRTGQRTVRPGVHHMPRINLHMRILQEEAKDVPVR